MDTLQLLDLALAGERSRSRQAEKQGSWYDIFVIDGFEKGGVAMEYYLNHDGGKIHFSVPSEWNVLSAADCAKAPVVDDVVWGN